MTLPPRFPLTRTQIKQVVAVFYQRARVDAVLGPVFAAHVTDWAGHEEKITRFWANAILHERSYDGNPMQKHLQAGNVKSEHFAIWLPLFDEVLFAELPSDTAKSWSALAHRIGRGLQYGVQDVQGGVPQL
jgi:hemoglobin